MFSAPNGFIFVAPGEYIFNVCRRYKKQRIHHERRRTLKKEYFFFFFFFFKFYPPLEISRIPWFPRERNTIMILVSPVALAVF